MLQKQNLLSFPLCCSELKGGRGGGVRACCLARQVHIPLPLPVLAFSGPCLLPTCPVGPPSQPEGSAQGLRQGFRQPCTRPKGFSSPEVCKAWQQAGNPST